MQYSAAQFRKVEHQFLEQFQLKTVDFYDHNVNFNNIIQYKKMLNHMKTQRKFTMDKKQKYNWFLKKGLSNDNFFNQKIDKSPVMIHPQQLNQQQQDDVGFYLTQNSWNSSKKRNQNSQLESKQNSRLGQSTNSRSLLKNKAQQKITVENENLNIDTLNDRIYGQYSVLQSLRHEQSQVQQAIFCFKKRIISLQQNLNSQDIKSKQVDRLLVQNNNQMLRAKHTNQQVKSAFLKTKKHFDLDLQGRKQIQVKFNQKNKQEFDQSIVNHIYMKKMKHHIAEQQKQLLKLDKVRHQLQKKQKKYKNIYLKQQQLYKAYQQIVNIDPAQFYAKPIVSILDKDFDQFQTKQDQKIDKSKSKKNKITLKDILNQSNNKKKLSMVVKQIIDLYHRMKHEQASKISQFKLLINQRNQKQNQYFRTVSKISQTFQTLYQKIQIIDPQQKQNLQNLIKQINQISNRKKFISTSSNGIQYRLKFYISKQLNILKKIVSNWLKSDKLANKHLDHIFMKFYDFSSVQATSKENNTTRFKATNQQQLQQRQLSIDDSRNLLISCFENWQDYVGFLDIIHSSPYIYRFTSKSKLFKLFKRIIKTKIANKNILTQDIFEKALNLSFDQGRSIHLKRIQNLLSVFRDLYNYLNTVKTGQIKLNCALNYDNPIQVRESQSNQMSKLVSRNQLQRFSTKKQLTLVHQRKSTGNKIQSIPQSQQLYNTFNDSKKFMSSNHIKEQDIITKLKKKKILKPLLNIHQFYQDLRQQIEKVNKISAY